MTVQQWKQYAIVTPAQFVLNKLVRATEGCKSVTELGAGLFTYINALPIQKRRGVEIFKGYIDAAYAPGVEMVHADMCDLDASVPEHVDCVLLIDALEHIPHEAGERLLSGLKDRTDKIVIFCPEGEDEQDTDPWGFNNRHQAHLSTWYTQELSDMGFDVELLEGYHAFCGRGNAMFAVWAKGEQ